MLIIRRQQPCIKVNVMLVHSTDIVMPAPSIFQRLCAFPCSGESEEQIGSRYQPGDLVDQIDRPACIWHYFASGFSSQSLQMLASDVGFTTGFKMVGEGGGS